MIDKVLNKINNELKINAKLEKKLFKKNTGRGLQKFILKEDNKKYLLEVATTPIQKFYLERSLEFQKKFQNLNTTYLLNLPLISNFGNQYSFVLYNYFESYQEVKDDTPIEALVNFYKSNSEDIEISDESVDKILKSFILAWPNQFHSFIKRTKEFQEYKKILLSMDTIKVSFEHGDYTKNNILKIDNKFYLMDFEFCREFQPLGFDIEYFNFYNKSTFGITKYKKYKKLNNSKIYLDYFINHIVDNNLSKVSICNSIFLKIRFHYIYKKELCYAKYKKIFK